MVMIHQWKNEGQNGTQFFSSLVLRCKKGQKSDMASALVDLQPHSLISWADTVFKEEVFFQ